MKFTYNSWRLLELRFALGGEELQCCLLSTSAVVLTSVCRLDVSLFNRSCVVVDTVF